MKILVTGGAGFIGSAVIRYIIKETSDSVVNIDKLTYAGNLESLAEVEHNNRYQFERADICDAEAMACISVLHRSGSKDIEKFYLKYNEINFPRNNIKLFLKQHLKLKNENI